MDSALQSLLAHYRSMPPVAAMRLEIGKADANSLRLHAPLEAHVNDKGCAFGGSLVSLMTLAGWGVATLALERAGLHADVFVASSGVRYRAPLFADLEAIAQAQASELAAFVEAFRANGRASLDVEARVPLPDGGRACDMRSRYVAIAKG
ncbi:MAG TPA: YiiD C-terminal domain-containing protein [Lysobacter sp.]|nr:YiiD C-terminal domain-containing protein [Lysobacter sp.]